MKLEKFINKLDNGEIKDLKPYIEKENIDILLEIAKRGLEVDYLLKRGELLAKWTNVELKRDDLVCVEWAKNYYLTVDLNNTHPNTYPFEPEDQ